MKGSNNKFRTDFENAWKDAFDGVESTPNPGSWGKIDGELNKAAFVKYKGYYKIYKAVAVVALLITSTVTVLYFTQNNDGNLLSSQNESEVISGIEDSNPTDENLASTPNLSTENTDLTFNSDTELETLNSEPSPQNNQIEVEKGDESVLAFQNIDKELKAQANIPSKSGAEIPPVNHFALQTANTESIAVLANKHQMLVVSIPAKFLEVNEHSGKDFPLVTKKTEFIWYNNLEETETKSTRKQNELYANVNLNSGFFNPNFEGGNMAGNALTSATSVINAVPNAIPANDLGIQNSPDASFSYGINMGMKLSGKWVIEGGVSYANYNSTMQTNVALQGTQGEATIPVTFQSNPESFDLKSPSVLDVNTSHSLNNSFEFASVPVQAGYVIGQKKLSLIVKAGVASDFFIRNEISENSESGFSVATNPGDVDNQFRRVYFNGSVGNEVNYSIHDNYSLSVEATYRFALNSFTKPTANFSSNPDGYAIGMVFRYHFKN